jgi:hypothetical protein
LFLSPPAAMKSKRMLQNHMSCCLLAKAEDASLVWQHYDKHNHQKSGLNDSRREIPGIRNIFLRKSILSPPLSHGFHDESWLLGCSYNNTCLVKNRAVRRYVIGKFQNFKFLRRKFWNNNNMSSIIKSW